MTPQLLTEKETAAVIRCAPATLRNWRSLNFGPRAIKVGKRMIRYSLADVEEFIQVQSSTGSPDEPAEAEKEASHASD